MPVSCHSAVRVSSLGTFSSRTMIVMMMANTPSLNASSRELGIVGLPSAGGLSTGQPRILTMRRYSDTGVFIALEGGEGAGKSTQASLLGQWLTELGLPVLLTREPGGTAVGAALRNLLLDSATGDIAARTEVLVYAADRSEHVDAVLDPAL